MADLINRLVYQFKFPDTKLGMHVTRACQALSIDDQRLSFEPVLWDEAEDRLEQVWFAGVHSNVGGGYPKQGLALESLCWMIDRCEAAGLRFVESEKRYFHERRDAADKLYDSRAGMAVYYTYEPRDVGKRSHESLRKGDKPRIHLGAIERIALRADGYGPLGFPKEVAVVTTERPTANQETVLRKIEELLAASHGKAVLTRAAVAVGLRRWSNIVMLVATLGLVAGLAKKYGWSKLGQAATSPIDFASWAYEKIASGEASVLLVSLAALPVVAYVVGSAAKGRIERVASKRWYATADQLRTLLAEYHATR